MRSTLKAVGFVAAVVVLSSVLGWFIGGWMFLAVVALLVVALVKPSLITRLISGPGVNRLPGWLRAGPRRFAALTAALVLPFSSLFGLAGWATALPPTTRTAAATPTAVVLLAAAATVAPTNTAAPTAVPLPTSTMAPSPTLAPTATTAPSPAPPPATNTAVPTAPPTATPLPPTPTSPPPTATPAPKAAQFQIAARNDVSLGAVKRLTIYLVVPVGSDEGTIEATVQQAVRQIAAAERWNAISAVVIDRPEDANDVYTLAKADWAPGGRWEDAGSRPTGDYSAHQFKFEFRKKVLEPGGVQRPTPEQFALSDAFWKLRRANQSGEDAPLLQRVAQERRVPVEQVKDAINAVMAWKFS